jgi:hypothetical protein
MAYVLKSWNEGAAKSAIVDFVTRVTKQGGRDYVPPAERIATFDNDGTLWCEQPVQVQVFFLLIHHDDNEREVAYDREFRLSPLAEALDKAGEYGITVVSMKRDWNTVFAGG